MAKQDHQGKLGINLNVLNNYVYMIDYNVYRLREHVLSNNIHTCTAWTSKVFSKLLLRVCIIIYCTYGPCKG